MTAVIRISNERPVSGHAYLNCDRRARRVGTFYEESVTTVEMPIVLLCKDGALVLQFRSGGHVAFDADPLWRLDVQSELAGILICVREGDHHRMWTGDTREVPWSCPEPRDRAGGAR